MTQNKDIKTCSNDKTLFSGVKLISVGGRPTVVGRFLLSTPFWPYSFFPCENIIPFLNSTLAVSKFSCWKGMERKRLNDFFATLKTKPGWLCQPTCSTEGVTSKFCKSCPTRSPSTPTWTRRPPDWTPALEVMAIGGTSLGKWSMARELCGRETHNNNNLGFSLTLLSRLLYQRSSSRLATVLLAMVLMMLLSQSRYCKHCNAALQLL